MHYDYPSGTPVLVWAHHILPISWSSHRAIYKLLLALSGIVLRCGKACRMQKRSLSRYRKAMSGCKENSC